jgi:hypothetical protein
MIVLMEAYDEQQHSIIDRKPLKADRMWNVLATHPSGQQEYFVGVHSQAEAQEAPQSRMCSVAKKERRRL